MIDSESARTVTTWLRLADRVAGVEATDGRCDRCGNTGYLSHAADDWLCAVCFLEGEAVAS